MYPHQLERLAIALDAPTLAAVVAATPANVAYLTGFAGGAAPADPAAPVLAVTARGATALLVSAKHASAVADHAGAVDHVIAYGRSPLATPAGAIAAALAALGVADGAVGVDDAGLTPAMRRQIVRSLGARVREGGAALAQARSVKGPWEIEALERALLITEEALNAVVQMLQPGVSEREAAGVFDAEMRRRGATPSVSQVAFGARTALPAGRASDHRLRAGDLIRLDAGGVWQGYRAEVARTAVMAAPGARQDTLAGAIGEGVSAAVDAIQPGVSAGALFIALRDAVRAAGLPGFHPEHAGHGIGLEASEPPLLVEGSDACLEPGMVICLDATHVERGWGGARVKDTVLVTRAGGRVMNRSHRGLVVLD